MKTAYYDPVSDTIANCTKHSYTWFHEKRHQYQYKTLKVGYYVDEIGMVAYNIGGIILVIGLLLEYILQTFILIGIITSSYIVLACLLEVDAYLFGTINYFKYKKEKEILK
jgi:Zn-dependent membrane protease YugP